MPTGTPWTTRTKAAVVALAVAVSGVIGFLASSKAVMDWIFPPTPDVKELMLPGATDKVAFYVHHLPEHLGRVVKYGEILVDGVSIELPDDSLLIANKLELRNGASIRGRKLNIAATVIEGGSLVVAGEDGAPGSQTKLPVGGASGGDIMVAAASITGTIIRADGGRGGDGQDGRDGSAMPRAAHGHDGDCGGFGAYRGADAGIPGQPFGQSGAPGQDGGAGGDGGNVLLIVPQSHAPLQGNADKGLGGRRGMGGNGGPGQQGGSGGAGCTGMGGSQPNAPDGANGGPGRRGDDGHPGKDGANGNFIMHRAAFKDVARAWKASQGDADTFINALRTLPQT